MSRNNPSVFDFNNCIYAIIDFQDSEDRFFKTHFKTILRQMVRNEYVIDIEVSFDAYYSETDEIKLAYAQRQILFIRNKEETRFYSNKYREDAEIIDSKITEGDFCFRIGAFDDLVHMVNIIKEMNIWEVYEINDIKAYNFGDFKVMYVKYAVE